MNHTSCRYVMADRQAVPWIPAPSPFNNNNNNNNLYFPLFGYKSHLSNNTNNVKDNASIIACRIFFLRLEELVE